jgi:UrcA family protein
MQHQTSVLIALAIASASAAPASAQSPADRDAPRAVVRYGDLDLSAPAGAKTLHGRIVRAARMVCGNDGHSRDLAAQIEARKCSRVALEQASHEEARAISHGAEGTSLALSRH